MGYIRQFAIDIEDNNYDITEEMIADALEKAGFTTWGCAWKATWTEEGYHKSVQPISYD